jgi:hypothetical protein
MAEEEGGTGIVGELRTAQETLEQAQARLEVERQILELKKEQGDVAQSDYETQLKINEISKIQAKIDDNRSQLAKFQADIAKATKDQNEKEVDRLKEQLELLKQQTVEEERQVELLTEQEKLRQSVLKHADNLFDRTFGFMYSEAPETSIGAFITDPAAFSGKMKENLGKLKDPLAVTRGLIDTTAQMSAKLALEQDAAVVSFNRATGASGEFDDNIRGLERSMFDAGVSSAEAAQAVQSLFINVSDFTEMSEAQQQTLGKTVAILNELGISAETTAKNIQFATKVLGQSTDEAAALQRELFVFAQDLGVSASQIAGDFQQMGPEIAAMGKNGVDAFRNLEAQSKSTGLAMSELLGIVQKFDRFDTAAESVSRLNALLGGPFLNATELVAETDLSKRFEILKNRVDDAGLSFDQMDYYQKKALASAIGLNEQQLALLMRGRIDLVQAPQKSAADIEALADQTAQFNTLMEELSQIAKSLAISFGPLVSVFKEFLDLISPIMRIVGPLIGGLALLRTVQNLLALATGKYTTQLVANTAAEGARAAATQTSAASQGVLNGVLATGGRAMASFAASASAAIPVLGTIAGVALSIAAAIGAIGLAIYMVVEGFKVIAGFMSNFIAGAVESLLAVGQGIATSIDKINDLELDKALAYTTTVTAYGVAATVPAAIANVAGGALDRVGIAAEAATPEPTATAPAVAGGPTPEIKLNIMIDGESLTGAVNNVEVSNYVNGQSSKLYASIIDAIVGTKLVSS